MFVYVIPKNVRTSYKIKFKGTKQPYYIHDRVITVVERVKFPKR